MILAGVLLKLGTYGFVRFGLYLFPEASVWFAPALVTLGVIGILYGAIVATMQRDLKRLVAYSSVAHLGFIVLGTFALTTQGIQGGVMQMVNHGLSTGALFLLVGMIYERRHTREISALKGLQKSAPILAGVFTLVMLSSIGLPGLNGFSGEFLILVGSFLTRRWFTIVAAVGRDPRRASTCSGPTSGCSTASPTRTTPTMPDLSWREGLVMAPLLGLIVFLGVYPQPMLDRIQPSVDRLVTHIEDNSDYVEPEVATIGAGEAAEGRARGRAGRGGARPRDASSRSSRQPIEQDPVPIDGVDVAWSALAPMLTLDRRRAAAPRSPTRCPPASRCGRCYALFTTLTAAGAIVFAVPLWDRVQDPDEGAFSTLGQAVGVDGFSVFATVTIAAAVILGALLMDGWLRREGMEGAEPYVLMLLSASGGVMMASANDLIVMFLGLEILSIAVYVLAAMHLRKITSQEAGVKYFVLGAFSSAFFLYGIAFTYGGTGSTNLVDIAEFLATTVLADTGLVLAGLALLLVGLRLQGGRRAVPLLDARRVPGRAQPERVVDGLGREGRRLRRAAPGLLPGLRHLPPRLAADRARAGRRSRMVVGSVLAIVQTDVKRMLAYSSINHAGFILVAVQAASDGGRAGGALLPGRLHLHGGRQLRDRHGGEPQGRRREQPRRLPRPLARPAGAGARLRAVPVRPGRRAAHLGLLRQVLRDHRGGRGRLHLAGDHRHAHRGRRRLPLPADHRVDVHVGRGRRRAAHHPGARSPPPWPSAPAWSFTLGVGLFPGSLASTAKDATPVLVLEPVETSGGRPRRARSLIGKRIGPGA